MSAGPFLTCIIIVIIKSKTMPIVKANEPLGPRPVIITIYGDPGIGKTSLVNTAKNPITIDGDRGISRSILRKDALVIDRWEEVIDMEKTGLLKPYSTIGVDTPKAILDDYMMSYVIRQDPKLKGNKLWAYGAIGDEYKLFTNNRRQDLADLVHICHAKKDEDSKRMVPDVTGQSYQLLLRISDMIGYYTIVNGRRMLFFEPTESTVGKNVACLPPIEVPDKTDPAFRTFLAELIEKVRAAIASQSEEQLEAQRKSELYQNEIHEVGTPDQLTALLEEVNALPDYLKAPLKKVISEKAKEKGWVGNKETKRFEAAGSATPATDPAAGSPVGGATTDQGGPATDPLTIITDTSFDDRCQALGNLGMTLEVDSCAGYGLRFMWDEMGEWTEEQYLDAIAKVNEAKKTHHKNGTKKGRQSAAATR